MHNFDHEMPVQLILLVHKINPKITLSPNPKHVSAHHVYPIYNHVRTSHTNHTFPFSAEFVGPNANTMASILKALFSPKSSPPASKMVSYRNLWVIPTGGTWPPLLKGKVTRRGVADIRSE